MHWHNSAEWGYVLKGTAQISTVNTDGQNYVKDVVRLLPLIHRAPILLLTSRG